MLLNIGLVCVSFIQRMERIAWALSIISISLCNTWCTIHKKKPKRPRRIIILCLVCSFPVFLSAVSNAVSCNLFMCDPFPSVLQSHKNRNYTHTQIHLQPYAKLACTLRNRFSMHFSPDCCTFYRQTTHCCWRAWTELKPNLFIFMSKRSLRICRIKDEPSR